MSEILTDNRFELIEKYKQELINATNIEEDEKEMAAIDNILFRFWQMGWLDKLEESDELRKQLNHCHDYIAELEAKCEELTEKLREAHLAVEHNRHVADEEQRKGELRYRDGVIYGLKYAMRCNGVSGGEVDR